MAYLEGTCWARRKVDTAIVHFSAQPDDNEDGSWYGDESDSISEAVNILMGSDNDCEHNLMAVNRASDGQDVQMQPCEEGDMPIRDLLNPESHPKMMKKVR